ncbi:MAG TPA: DUF4426 domain-containing protein [Gammaproteobacteria bacterium]|nr:DUF4426 domain-containing protein [Gammaproteobacteria bacterium]
MSRQGRLGLIAGMALVTGACGQSAPNAAQGNGTDEVMRATESFRVFGNYELHFNALTTDQLNEMMATEHGIVRSRNRVLLNVSVLRSQEIGVPTAVAAEVRASARNLTGQLRNLAVREVRDGDAIYYIGEMPIANAETLIFTVEALPESETETLTVSFQKQFFIDE